MLPDQLAGQYTPRQTPLHPSLPIDWPPCCPSSWLAEHARASSLFAGRTVHVVPNAFSVENFRPHSKVMARRYLRLPQDRKLILFGEHHLRRTLNEFVAHYHSDRPHQGIGNRRIAPTADQPPDGEQVVVDERLGGLLRSYRRSA